MKINNLNKINTLNEKAKLLLNARINEPYYDYYFEKPIEWLLENEDKINNDFINNIEKLKFDIILNTNLDERINLIYNINNIDEFTNYINYMPFAIMSKKQKNEVIKMFDKLCKIEDKTKKIEYFERIKRI